MSLQQRWPSMRRTSRNTSARPHRTWVRWRLPGCLSRTSLLWAIVLLLGACIMPGDAAPVLKIGLIAPFEGLGRPLGYAVLPAVQQVMDAANASGELGAYRLLVVALNDDLDPAVAAAQAAALAEDPAVVAVIGPFTTPTAAQAAPILAAAGIPAVVAAPLDAPSAGIYSLCPDSAVIASEIKRVMGESDLVSCSNNAIDSNTTACPTNPAAAALSEEGFMARGKRKALAYWPGQAAEAAAWLTDDTNIAFEGVLIGGPDLLKPWFIERAGAAGVGTRAVACSLRGAETDGGEMPEVGLARAGAGHIVAATASSVWAGHAPTRAQVAAALRAQQIEPELVWYEVAGGHWRATE